MPDYLVAFWNVENLFAPEDHPQRPAWLQQRVGGDLEGWDEAEPIVAKLSVEQKREVMDGLVHAVLADGKVSPHEMKTIEKLSAALGLD